MTHNRAIPIEVLLICSAWAMATSGLTASVIVYLAANHQAGLLIGVLSLAMVGVAVTITLHRSMREACQEVRTLTEYVARDVLRSVN